MRFIHSKLCFYTHLIVGVLFGVLASCAHEHTRLGMQESGGDHDQGSRIIDSVNSLLINDEGAININSIRGETRRLYETISDNAGISVAKVAEIFQKEGTRAREVAESMDMTLDELNRTLSEDNKSLNEKYHHVSKALNKPVSSIKQQVDEEMKLRSRCVSEIDILKLVHARHLVQRSEDVLLRKEAVLSLKKSFKEEYTWQKEEHKRLRIKHGPCCTGFNKEVYDEIRQLYRKALYNSEYCSYCGRRAAEATVQTLLTCSCKRVLYCTRECQEADWEEHKKNSIDVP